MNALLAKLLGPRTSAAALPAPCRQGMAGHPHVRQRRRAASWCPPAVPPGLPPAGGLPGGSPRSSHQ
jgi:hypothetical protein